MPGVAVAPEEAPLTETDTFTTRVYPRNEFVQTSQTKTSPTGCYCPATG